MYTAKKILFLHCETPLHAGSGSQLGFVDLPIQREKHTGFPKIEGSSLKGALRNALELKLGEKGIVDVLFGPEDTDEGHAGALAFSDARLLLFPVKSAKGIFAYTTCPYALSKFAQEAELAGIGGIPEQPEINTVSDDQALVYQGKAILEEYAFSVRKTDHTAKWGEFFARLFLGKAGERIQKHMVVLNDNDFTNFALYATEVITRNKIDNKTGTVAQGALFSEEFLPQSSLLYSLVMGTRSFAKDDSRAGAELLQEFSNALPRVFQCGGDASIGKGLLRTAMAGGGA